MGPILQKKDKEILKKGKYLKIWAKISKIWEYFEKRQVIAYDNRMQLTARIGTGRVVSSCSEVASIQFIKEVSYRLNCFIES